MTRVSAERVRGFVLARLAESFDAKHVDSSGLPENFDLLDGGIIDSIGMLELVVAVEDEFGIEVDFEELDTDEMTKLDSFCRYVEAHAGAADQA